jgi:hypothetical protein
MTVCAHRGLDAVDLGCNGPRTSYLVDHFSVFSYPGHSTFLFLHCKQEPAVSSHLSCALVSLIQRNGGDVWAVTLLSLHRLHPFLDFVFFTFESCAVALSLANVCISACKWRNEDMKCETKVRTGPGRTTIRGLRIKAKRRRLPICV